MSAATTGPGEDGVVNRIPKAVLKAWRRLPRLTESLVRQQAGTTASGDGSPLARLSAEELKALKECLKPINNFLKKHESGSPAAGELIGRDAPRLALLQLLAAALRLQPEEVDCIDGNADNFGPHVGVATLVIGICARLACALVNEHHSPQAAQFVEALLRGDALQAASLSLDTHAATLVAAQKMQATSRKLAAELGPLLAAALLHVMAQRGLNMNPEELAALVRSDARGLGTKAAQLAEVMAAAAQRAGQPLPSADEPMAILIPFPIIRLTASLVLFIQNLSFLTAAWLATRVVGSTGGGWTPQVSRLASQFTAAQEGSGALEHAARTLLLLLPLPMGALGGGEEEWHLFLEALLTTPPVYKFVTDLLYLDQPDPDRDGDGDGGGGGSLRMWHLHREENVPRLRRVFTGRCVQHLALTLGIVSLRDADGGPAYGLPKHLLNVLPQGMMEGEEDGTVRCDDVRVMVRLLALDPRPQPPGRRGALALALRVCRLAVASGRALLAAEGEDGDAEAAEEASSSGEEGASSSGGAGSGGGGGAGAAGTASAAADRTQPRLPMEEHDLFDTALDALRTTSELLLQRPSGAQAPPDVAAAERRLPAKEAAEWWRLALELGSGHLLELGRTKSVGDAGRLLVWSREVEVALVKTFQDLLRLPASPPPWVAAALKGGLLPCLARLLRRAARAPEEEKVEVVRVLLGRYPADVWLLLAPLLAYGEERQALSLVATLGKLLRRGGAREAGPAAGDGAGNLQRCFVNAARAVVLVTAAAADQAAGPAAPPGGPSQASQQLLRVLSFALCHWLPSLSQQALARLTAASQAPRDAVGPIGTARSNAIGEILALKPVFCWVAQLAARCGDDCVPTTTDPQAAAGAVAGAPGSDGGGWRALLLEEVGAVPLLGAALRLVPSLPDDKGSGVSLARELASLVRACRAVAAVHAGQEGRDSAGTEAALAAPASAAVAELGGGGDGCSASGSGGGGPGTGGGGHGICCPAAGGSMMMLSPLPWKPVLLRTAAARLHAYGDTEAAAEAEALAAQLKAGGGDGGRPLPPAEAGALAAALLPPAEARRLLRVYANPACATLSGDSEAGLPLMNLCGGSGAAGYC